MSAKDLTTSAQYFHPTDPAGWLKPDESLMVDGLDWSWAFVWYREVPEFPAYCVGSNGTVWSRIKKVREQGRFSAAYDREVAWRQLNPSPLKKYFRVKLHRDGFEQDRYLHRLVLETFVGPCPPGMECLHEGDNTANNRLANLTWGTRLENAQAAVKNGRQPKGEDCHTAKLDAEAVLAIRELHAKGDVTQEQLATMYGVSRTAVTLIVWGRVWLHVGGPISKERYKRCKLSQESADQIRELASRGVSRNTLATRFGVSRTTIFLVVSGLAWTEKPDCHNG